jgi:hypothetical protein
MDEVEKDFKHTEFDDYFEQFSSFLKPNFTSLIATNPEEWSKRFGHLTENVKSFSKVIDKFSNNAAQQALAGLLVQPKRGDHYIIKTKAKLALKIFLEALEKGFILDYVLDDGPTPSTKWEPSGTPFIPISIPESPVKIPDPLLMPKGSEFHEGSDSSSIEESDDALPSKDALDRKINELLASPPTSLPLSTNPGKSLSYSSKPAVSKPVVSNPRPLTLSFAPVPNQKIYKLGKFLPTFALDYDETKVVVKDGKLVLDKSNLPKVDTPHAWSVAMLALGRHLEYLKNTRQSEEEFLWEDFSLYMERITSYFGTYSFSSVIAFDINFRKWRRFWKERWVTENAFLKDTLLQVKTKIAPTAPTATPTTPQRPLNPQTNFCKDFNKGSCQRNNCKYRHICVFCGGNHSVVTCPQIVSKPTAAKIGPTGSEQRF